MTEHREGSPDINEDREIDLREVLRPGQERSSSGYGHRKFEPPPELPEQKLPPVWPGDENQEWFRRERGMPPLPEEKKLGYGDFPTEPALPQMRARAWGVAYGLAFGMLLTTFLSPFGFLLLLANVFFFHRGQDVGSLIFKTRVLRENGDVAGFFHMWTRAFASIVSLLAFGAGFWTALSDPEGRTWHDKWTKTYVVLDSDEYRNRKRSSSSASASWFWITFLVFIAAPILLSILAVMAESAPAVE